MRRNKNYLLPPMFGCCLIVVILVLAILDAGGTLRLQKPDWLSFGDHRPKTLVLNEEQSRVLVGALVQVGRAIERESVMEEIRGNTERMKREMDSLFNPWRVPWYEQTRPEKEAAAGQTVASRQRAEEERQKQWQW